MEEQQSFATQIALRCTDDLRDALEKLAARDHRPLANYIRLVLEEHVRDKEKRSKKAA